MKKYNLIMDPGHAGMAFGNYMRAGKRSPEIPPGIYEGDYNRQLANSVKLLASRDRYPTRFGFDVEILNPGPMGISDRTKVNFVNQVARLEDVILLCNHCNASRKKGWSNARGFKLFIGSNASKTSKMFATMINYYMGEKLDHAIPSRGISTRDFTILTETSCPAVYFEVGFMTNKHEVQLLQKYRSTIASAIIESVMAINQNERREDD